MATPVVVPCLLAFDRELTTVAPNRTLPTWYQGDRAHQQHSSGHNADDTPGSKAESQDTDSIPEIRAGDYRLPLNSPIFTAEQLVQYLVQECRAGRITWIKYIIFNRRIWSASDGWVTRAYNGSNPHDQHFHISAKSDTASENNTKPVGLKQWVSRLLINNLEKVKMIQFSGELPELEQGMSDPVIGGVYVRRVQTMLNWILPGEPLVVDGDYGQKTADAVKALNTAATVKSSTDGSKVGFPEYQRLYGF